MKRMSPTAGLQEMSQRMPLELKLPLLMSAVLALVLSMALVAMYTTLRNSALERIRERLDRGTRQIATVGAAGVSSLHPRFRAVANDSAIRNALRRGDTSATESARAALGRLSMPADSGMPVELWTADGRRIAFVGDDVRLRITAAPGRPELPERIASAFGDETQATGDSVRFGPLYPDGGRVHYWIVKPVREGRNVLGYITHQRRISPGTATQRTLRELSGDSVSLYYRNIDASFWATGTSVSVAPLRDANAAKGTARSPDGERLLFHEERIGSTPLVVGMHIPERNVLARPQRTIRTVLLLSIALLIGGVLASWAIGRSVARPLSAITRAAGSLAAGNYEARVPESGEHEVRRLAASFNHMAAEIGTSRAALEQQTREAQAANAAKSEFLTTMSHELRTPLNAIGGYVQLLDMELRGPVSEAQRRDLQRIRASQEHLLGLISAVLDLSRIEAGRVAYDLTNVAVDPFLAGMDALVAPQASAKTVNLEYVPCPPDMAALADREKLRQVLLNLLSNAIRHTPHDGRVTLWAQPRDSHVAIIVDDTGPGIPTDKREAVFEPFVQLDRTLTQPRDGLGLGLAISRDLARGMGGDLTVEQQHGTGARFVLILKRGVVDPNMPLAQTGEMPAAPIG